MTDMVPSGMCCNSAMGRDMKQDKSEEVEFRAEKGLAEHRHCLSLQGWPVGARGASSEAGLWHLASDRCGPWALL